MNKYKMVKERGTNFFRIVATRSFGSVKKGEQGGLIEKEENLSQAGLCWVFDDATVDGWARVSGNAIVSENATVYGNAVIYGRGEVSGNARVYGNAKVSGDAKVYGDAEVYGNAQVYGDAMAKDSDVVCGFSSLSS